MGFFKKLVKGSDKKISSRAAILTVKEKKQLGKKGVEVSFNIPADLSTKYHFVPGQYVNLHLEINGEIHNRSYSICSAPLEGLNIGVKAIDGGIVSNFILNSLQVGQEVQVDFPAGNFKLNESDKLIVAFCAGSGITPVMSMAKSIEGSDSKLHLFYGNKSQIEGFFINELNALKNTLTTFTYSQETIEGHDFGRLDKTKIAEFIKSDLNLLRADAFYLCGPEKMILDGVEVLESLGVSKEKVHFELFTTPVLMNQQIDQVGEFEGDADLSAHLDGELVKIKLHSKGKTILDALDDAGLDVPFSCKGGVCCTCKAKLVEGTARMNFNYALNDEEVKQGYILCCQAHPTSPVVKIDFDA